MNTPLQVKRMSASYSTTAVKCRWRFDCFWSGICSRLRAGQTNLSKTLTSELLPEVPLSGDQAGDMLNLSVQNKQKSVCPPWGGRLKAQGFLRWVRWRACRRTRKLTSIWGERWDALASRLVRIPAQVERATLVLKYLRSKRQSSAAAGWCTIWFQGSLKDWGEERKTTKLLPKGNERQILTDFVFIHRPPWLRNSGNFWPKSVVTTCSAFLIILRALQPLAMEVAITLLQWPLQSFMRQEVNRSHQWSWFLLPSLQEESQTTGAPLEPNSPDMIQRRSVSLLLQTDNNKITFKEVFFT